MIIAIIVQVLVVETAVKLCAWLSFCGLGLGRTPQSSDQTFRAALVSAAPWPVRWSRRWILLFML